MTVCVIKKRGKIIPKIKKWDIFLPIKDRWINVKFVVMSGRCLLFPNPDGFSPTIPCHILLEVLGPGNSFNSWSAKVRPIGLSEKRAYLIGWPLPYGICSNLFYPYRNTWILKAYRTLNKTIIKEFNVIDTICSRALSDPLNFIYNKRIQETVDR